MAIPTICAVGIPQASNVPSPNDVENDCKSSNGRLWHVPVSAAIGGAIGGYVCFPFEGLKKRLQSSQPITMRTFHPKELMRGSTSFSGAVTAATVGSMIARRVIQAMPGYDPSSQTHEAFSAITGGVVGSFVGSTPVENITQQLNKTGPLGAARILFKQGVTRPWVGGKALAGREAGFSGVAFWGGRAANKAVYERTQNSALAYGAEIAVDIGGATITHSFDTIATHQQKANGTLSFTKAYKKILREQGRKGFFAGVYQRWFLFTGCAVIIPRAAEFVLRTLKSLDHE
jgi:hypothetical protein